MTQTIGELADSFTSACRKSPDQGALKLIGAVRDHQKEFGTELTTAWRETMACIAHIYGVPAFVMVDPNLFPKAERKAVAIASEALRLQS